jgi:predicted ATPase
VDAVKTRSIPIVLESHSEHLLRRLQRRIAEEASGLTHQDVALYFCTTDEQGTSQLQPLEIDPYGNITNWPKDFFGDEMADLLAMTQAMMKRQREEEENELHRD